MAEKQCTRCGIVKSIYEFGKYAGTGFAASGQCRPCYAKTQSEKFRSIRKAEHELSLIGVRCKVCDSIIEGATQKSKIYCSNACKSRQRRIDRPEKVKGQQRAYYKRNIEKLRAQARDARNREKEDPVRLKKRREYRKEYKRKLRRAAGVPKRGSLQQHYLAGVNARQAWRYWIKTAAPDWWLNQYYMATGKPWNDHRLSEAEKYTCRYDNDAAYREKERERVRMYKYSHPETVAGWKDTPCNRRKWNQAAISADGTVTKAVIRRLTVEENCAYCHAPLTADNRHIDHVTPLSRGGVHSADNIVAACQSCNATKGAKKLWQWFEQAGNRIEA